ncbi:FecR family protein [Parapedobacter sp.]
MEYENRIDSLIAKLAAGNITDAEIAELTRWYNGFDDTNVILSAMDGDNAEQLKARMYRQLTEKIGPAKNVTRQLIRRWLPYVAAILLAAVGVWYSIDKASDPTPALEIVARDTPPGGNRATLTLADGRTLILSEDHAGIAINDSLTYLDGTGVIDSQALAHTDNGGVPLALVTPRGGTYQIVLSDGTRVWLNAASSLKYPSKFNGNERIVELEGEAFFEVNKQQGKPFKVISDDQIVEVLGTQFNVSGYPDERHTKTTLVTGRVQVASRTNLGSPMAIKPGQQSIVQDGNIHITTADTNQIIAWKQGIFHFESTPLEEMLKQIARWYDVHIVYKKGIPNETFTGKFRRDVSLEGVIDILRLSKIDVTLENKRIIIN